MRTFSTCFYNCQNFLFFCEKTRINPLRKKLWNFLSIFFHLFLEGGIKTNFSDVCWNWMCGELIFSGGLVKLFLKNFSALRTGLEGVWTIFVRCIFIKRWGTGKNISLNLNNIGTKTTCAAKLYGPSMS